MRARGRRTTVFRVVTFDLFGTLVGLDERRLPQMNVDGRLLPSLLAAPFNLLRKLVPSVNMADALVSYFEAGAELRRPNPSENRELPPSMQLTVCLERIGIDDAALAAELTRVQMEATIVAACCAENAVSLLERLRCRGCKLGLISNFADPVVAYTLLSRLRLDQYFDAVVFSADVGWRKPDRRMFQTALSALHAAAPAVLHVGDELRADVLGAGQCGLGTVWVNTNGEKFNGAYPPLLEIHDLADLAEAGLTP